MIKKLIFFFCFIVYYNLRLNAQSWNFELHCGWADNFPSRLIIKQKNYPDINLIAHYKSEPFISPVYWLWRFRYENKNNRSWQFEAVHHKLYLKNCPPEVESFGISHGLNLLLIDYVIIKNNLHFDFGLGCVLAHPENNIRGNHLRTTGVGILGWGYYFSGLAANLSAGYRYYLTERLYINTEIRFNPSYSVVPVFDGKAYVPNYSYQIIGGLGYCFWKK